MAFALSVSPLRSPQPMEGLAIVRPIASPEQKKDGGQDTLTVSPEAQDHLQTLKKRDQEVKAHEAAHMAAGAGLVRGGATYSYERGSDGQMYAVGGEVSLDASEVPNDPAATLQKALRLKSAALAPAAPSGQDRTVAAHASAMAAKAAADLAKMHATQSIGTKRDRVA